MPQKNMCSLLDVSIMRMNVWVVKGIRRRRRFLLEGEIAIHPPSPASARASSSLPISRGKGLCHLEGDATYSEGLGRAGVESLGG